MNDLICMIAFARGVTWLGAGRPAGALEHLTRVFDRNDPAFQRNQLAGALDVTGEAPET